MRYRQMKNLLWTKIFQRTMNGSFVKHGVVSEKKQISPRMKCHRNRNDWNLRTWIPYRISLKIRKLDASQFLKMEISRVLWNSAHMIWISETRVRSIPCRDSMSWLMDNRMYREKTKPTNCAIIQLCYKIIDDKKLTAKHYKVRTEILNKIEMFKIQSYTRNIKTLDTKGNVAHLC